MAVEARAMLIRTGENLDSWGKDIVYDLPVECSGFNPVLVKVPLNDSVDVVTLIPGFKYQPSEFAVQEAICVLDGDKANLPVAALVKGFYFSNQWRRDSHDKSKFVTVRETVISIASLGLSPQQVILSSFETRPLENQGKYWPGYTLMGHEKNLKLGLETISIEKRGDQFTISFPEGDAV